MKPPEPNMPLLRRILHQIDEHPETYEQSVYASDSPCGTSYCVAGHAAVMSGAKPYWQRLDPLSTEPYFRADETEDGEMIRVVAQQALGLTDDEACQLFDSENCREDVELVAYRIAGRAGEPLWPEGWTP
jgi:hypothetical protein